MKLNESSNIVYFDDTPLSRAELLSLHFPFKMRDYLTNVVRIDDKYFYAKACSTTEIINELIGTYLSKLVGLDVVDYRIGKTNVKSDTYYALSEIFYRDGFDYTTVEDCYMGMRPDDSQIYNKGISGVCVCDTTVLDIISEDDLIQNVLKLTAVDLKMGQTDRYNYNVVLRNNGTNYELEKIFDFSSSYGVDTNTYSSSCYYNPFLVVKKNTISLLMLAYRYKLIKQSITILGNTPLYDVIKDIEELFNITIEDKDIMNHIEMDNNICKILRKIR